MGTQERETTEAIPEATRTFVPSVGHAAGPPAFDGLSVLEGTADIGLSSTREFLFLTLRFFVSSSGWWAAAISWSQIRSYPPYICSGGVPRPTKGAWSHVFGGYLGIRPIFLIVRVVLCQSLWSTVVIIADGCCCSALVLWALSTTTFRLPTTTISTITSFVRIKWWRDEDSGAPSARTSVYSRC
jgi:hypothetical protein